MVVCLSGYAMLALGMIWAPISILCLAPFGRLAIGGQPRLADLGLSAFLFLGGWLSIGYTATAWLSRCM